MSRFPSKFHLAACLRTALLLLLSMPLAAQEANDLDGALSINGTGRVGSAGAIRQTNAALVPTPLFSAPLYHHRAQLGGSIEFRIQSTAAGQPFVLLSGSMAPFGTPIGGELFELNFLDFAIIINGTAPTGLIN